MKVDMVKADGWFVLLIDGQQITAGHTLTGSEAFEIISDMVKTSNKYIGSFSFKQTYLDDADQAAIDKAVDRIIRDWEVQKTLQWFPEEWKLALFNVANGGDYKFGEYPYGILEKCNVLDTGTTGQGANLIEFYTITPHGRDVVEYLEKTKFPKKKKKAVSDGS